jgi:hypothetical protein
MNSYSSKKKNYFKPGKEAIRGCPWDIPAGRCECKRREKPNFKGTSTRNQAISNGCWWHDTYVGGARLNDVT